MGPPDRQLGFRGRMGSDADKLLSRSLRFAAAAALCIPLAQCSASTSKLTSRLDPKYGVSASPRVIGAGDPVPKGGGTFRVGKPYTVAGRMYVPQENPNYRAEGLASWYGDDFHGRLTANGEVFDMTSITAAHPTMPMPSYARVTNMHNGKSLIVRVNDRGPYHGNRVIDVSNRAAKLLEFDGKGTARVRVEYVGRASLDGSDDRQLMATLRTGTPAPSPSTVMIASAKPFVPEMSSPLRGSIRGDVPMPDSRPYTLGHTQADMASIGATSDMTASRRRPTVERYDDNPRAASYERQRRAPDNIPTAAYAPAYTGGQSGSAGQSMSFSGRGLY